MEHWSPLLQTVLWVGLVAAVLYRYHVPIDGILRSLHQRIESGSGVRAGPFELAQATPQKPEEQVQKLDDEIAQLTQAADDAAMPAQAELSSTRFRADYQRAEDLALRALQSEYGVPISRQMRIGRDFQVDGMFAKDGAGFVIEIKFVQRRLPNSVARQTIERVFSQTDRFAWRNISMILAVVIGEAWTYGRRSKDSTGSRGRSIRELSYGASRFTIWRADLAPN